MPTQGLAANTTTHNERRLIQFKTAAIEEVNRQNENSLFPLPAWLDAPAFEPPHVEKARQHLASISFPEERIYLVELFRVLSDWAPPWSLVVAWFENDERALMQEIILPEKPHDADPMDHFLKEVAQYSKASPEAQTLLVAYLLALFEEDGVEPTFAAWWERPVLAMTQADPRLRESLLTLLGLEGVSVARPWER